MAARRDASIDLLRLLSTVAVVGIHTLIRTARMSFPLHCLYSLCFFAVPVFFLCSGYFVLNKPEISWRYVGHRAFAHPVRDGILGNHLSLVADRARRRPGLCANLDTAQRQSLVSGDAGAVVRALAPAFAPRARRPQRPCRRADSDAALGALCVGLRPSRS